MSIDAIQKMLSLTPSPLQIWSLNIHKGNDLDKFEFTLYEATFTKVITFLAIWHFEEAL